ncbi:PQ-loop repeat [Dillenia turbinata]|uniref:PQ-loop repeat n=1 Tax=Dillenia turbinata TaxID=194707 RepID=A0AAN8VEK9_9MAGN
MDEISYGGVLIQCCRTEFRFCAAELDEALLLSYLKRHTLLQRFCSATMDILSLSQGKGQNHTASNGMIPVAENDVAFSSHAVLLTAITLFQIFIYERGAQKFSKIAIAIVIAVWFSAAVCVFVTLPRHSWLWLISIFNTIRVIMTTIKYMPQAFMNFQRKSTVGFSIGNILLDLLGDSWVNFYGNIGKTLLSLVSIFFDLLFIFQHYVLYPAKKAVGNKEMLSSEQTAGEAV